MFSSKKSLSLFLCTLAIVIAMAALIGHGQNKLVPSGQEKAPASQGVMTEKQKAHSKLYKHGGRKLRDLAAAQGGDVTVGIESPMMIASSNETAPQRPFIQDAACNADAIVVGTLKSESPQFTEDENFIFTDYELTVEEVIKDNPAAHIQTMGNLTLTRDGGTLTANGRTFRAVLGDFKPFNLSKSYLFFLRFIPATGAYQAYAEGSFQLNNNKVTAFGNVAYDKSKDATTFLEDTRAAVTANCKKGK